MTFYSWNTADTGESIPNVYSSKLSGVVYLLQPHNKKPIREAAYKGYGVFGKQDVFIWLAKHNLPEALYKSLDNRTRQVLGKYLNNALLFAKDADGWTYVNERETAEVLMLMRIVDLNKTTIIYDIRSTFLVNGTCLTWADHVEQGNLLIQTPPSIKYPLKFSFNRTADYSTLPASVACDKQGYFYD